MTPLRDHVMRAFGGLVGAVASVAGAIALAFAAVIPPILGLFAILLWPLRVLLERLRRQQ